MRIMTLDEYMNKNGMKDAEMAEKLDVTVVSVGRYRNRKRRPTWEVMQRIIDVTQGAVTFQDFMEGAA